MQEVKSAGIRHLGRDSKNPMIAVIGLPKSVKIRAITGITGEVLFPIKKGNQRQSGLIRRAFSDPFYH